MPQIYLPKKPKAPVGLKQIAAAAGVSISTVSMSLGDHPDVAEQTRRRIHQISRRMGYQRLRRLPGKKQAVYTSTAPSRIGFIVLGDGMQKESNQSILHALTPAATTRHMRLEVFCLETADRVAAERSRIIEYAASLDGVILTGLVDSTLLSELENEKIPHVLYGTVWGADQRMTGPHGQIVAPDGVGMGELAVQTLLAEGHRRITFICNTAPRGLWHDLWLRGYRHALIDAGIQPDETLVHIINNAPNAVTRIAQALSAATDPPTAYIFPGLTPAIELAAAMRALGREINPQSVIVGAYKESYAIYGLAGCRGIGSNLKDAAQLLIHELCNLFHQPMPCPTRLTLPFGVVSLPVG